MSETTMPAAEAAQTVADERNRYELAFHVLPTVAEGEVPGVFDAIKALITQESGECFDEEAPQRFDLAYEVVKHIDGKNRTFASAYFGWVRFKANGEAAVAIEEEIKARPDILRYLLVKLTKTEEEHSFRFHEALADEKMVTTVEESNVIPDTTTVTKDEQSQEKSEEIPAETKQAVDEDKLEEALEKDEA